MPSHHPIPPIPPDLQFPFLSYYLAPWFEVECNVSTRSVQLRRLYVRLLPLSLILIPPLVQRSAGLTVVVSVL